MQRLRENTGGESCDSSTENLGGSSTGGSVEGGSTDNLTQHSSQKRSKLFSAFSNKVNKIGSEVWTSRRSSIDSMGKPRASKSSSESLNKTPIKSPSRTPVTENDPLGALISEVEGIEKQSEETHKTVSRVSSEIELDQSGAPVCIEHFLFINNCVNEFNIHYNILQKLIL